MKTGFTHSVSSLYSLVAQHLEVERGSEDHVYAFAESALYLCNAVSAFEYQRLVRRFCVNVSAKKFRLLLQDSKYTNLNLKLFCFRLAVHKPGTRGDAAKIAGELGLAKSDARLLYMLYSKNDWFKKELNRRVRLVPKNHPHLTEKGVAATFHQVYGSVHKYIKHIVYRKLRFLVKSMNCEFADYHSEISTKVVQSFYSMVPVLNTDAYTTNYLKRSAHNHAINIIKSETTQKRGRLISVGYDRNEQRQFSLLCVSENQATPVFDESGNPITPDAADEANSSSTFELRFSIGEILKRVQKNAKKFRLLSILLGTEDKEFSEWLQAKNICKQHEDNLDVQESQAPATYTRLVADFLNVCHQKVERFLFSLRNSLALSS